MNAMVISAPVIVNAWPNRSVGDFTPNTFNRLSSFKFASSSCLSPLDSALRSNFIASKTGHEPNECQHCGEHSESCARPSQQ